MATNTKALINDMGRDSNNEEKDRGETSGTAKEQ